MKKDFILIAILVSSLFVMFCSKNKRNNSISASGTIEATEVVISSKSAGEIISIYFKEGMNINAGDTLCIVDHKDLDIQLKQAESALNLADAQLRLVLKGARQEEIDQASELVNQALAQLKNAEDDLKRLKSLYENNSVTSKQLDDATTRYTIAEAQYKSALKVLERIKAGARTEEIEMARSRKTQAEAVVESIKKRIDDCAIVSSVSGTITEKLVEKGELIGLGTQVARVMNLNKVWLMIYVGETQLGKIRLGQKVKITIDSSDKTFTGEVTYISPNAEFTPKNIQTKEERVRLVFGIKIEIDNKEHILKPGMPADAMLEL